MDRIRLVRAIGDADPEKELNINILTTFISHHKILKALSITVRCDNACKIKILQTFTDSCKELEELTIDIDSSPEPEIFFLAPLQTLKSLRSLTLWCEIFNDFQFLSTLENLRVLNLTGCTLPKNSTQFRSLVLLTKLKIAGYHPFDQSDSLIDVVGIVSILTNLENLIVDSATYPIPQYKFFDLTETHLSKIANIVKDRSKILTLECECDFEVKNCMKNQPQLIFVPLE